MSTPVRAPLRAFARRRAPRCPLQVPVRVTVLRSGAAFSIPGRSLDLCEGGIAAVLSGDIRPDDSVGVEFLLPDLGLGLQAKAVVRHHSPLRCGLEFSGLTRHQQAVIREWTRQTGPSKPEPSVDARQEEQFPSAPLPVTSRKLRIARVLRILRWAAVILALLALVAWWRWERGWKELEEQIEHPAAHAVGALVPIFPDDL